MLGAIAVALGLGMCVGLLLILSPTPLEPEPEPTLTPEPTKFARFVPPPTSTPSLTPSSTPTVAPTRSNTPTRTRTATRTATLTPRPLPSATATVEPISVGEKYGTLPVASPSVPLAELNLTARGYSATSAAYGLVDYTGPYDEGAPQLYRIFSDERIPALVAVYQVNNWDALCNCRGELQSDPSVTMIGVAATPAEVLRLPRSSYYIANDYQAVVIYADADRITLNFTRAANPIRGYTLYLEGVAVDSSLVGLYESANAAGRANLPALQPGQGMGRARGGVVMLAIRDAGGFMDPRSRKDWWRGR